MSRLVLNDVAITQLLTGPEGPVLRTVRDFADAVVVVAKELAPDDHGTGGALREDLGIKEELVEPGASVTLRVGTDPVDPRNGFGYALTAHEGHGFIHPRADNPSGYMRFWWAREGRFVNDFRVVAPTSGTPFLTEALTRVSEATGEVFAVVVRP